MRLRHDFLLPPHVSRVGFAVPPWPGYCSEQMHFPAIKSNNPSRDTLVASHMYAVRRLQIKHHCPPQHPYSRLPEPSTIKPTQTTDASILHRQLCKTSMQLMKLARKG